MAALVICVNSLFYLVANRSEREHCEGISVNKGCGFESYLLSATSIGLGSAF